MNALHFKFLACAVLTGALVFFSLNAGYAQYKGQSPAQELRQNSDQGRYGPAVSPVEPSLAPPSMVTPPIAPAAPAVPAAPVVVTPAAVVPVVPGRPGPDINSGAGTAPVKDPCEAYKVIPDTYAVCQDRMMKIQRMLDARTQRENAAKAATTPPPVPAAPPSEVVAPPVPGTVVPPPLTK